MNGPISPDRVRSILVMLATAATIAFNGLASAGYVGGVTPAQISDKYPTILTPAGYAFSIWSLIYLGLAAFSIYQMLPANLLRFRGLRTLYIMSCLLNIGWISLWHQDRVDICVVLIFGLAAVLFAIITRPGLRETVFDAWVVQGTFGLYAGWVMTAAIVNVFVYLASIGSVLAASSWLGSAGVLFAAAAAAAVAWKIGNHFFPLAVAWALTAIAVRQSGETLLVAACAAGVVVCLVASLSFIMRLPSTRSEADE